MTVNIANNISLKGGRSPPRSGYDIPVYGLDNGEFYPLHITALVCILLSMISVSAILVASFRNGPRCGGEFFSRMSKSERFVVYVAICDGLFNVVHSMDHLQMVITLDYVYPKTLCSVYGFLLVSTIMPQHLMTNAAALNIFAIVILHRDPSFGRYDYKLLLWTFGAPLLLATGIWFTGSYGPSRAACFLDNVTGSITNIVFSTAGTTLILLVNAILYMITWCSIRREQPQLKDVQGYQTQRRQRSHKVAQTMSLVVLVSFIQWSALSVYGIGNLIGGRVFASAMLRIVTVFVNLGGVLNGIIFVIIRRRRRRRPQRQQKEYAQKPERGVVSFNNALSCMTPDDAVAGRQANRTTAI